MHEKYLIGSSSRLRTYDIVINSHALYQLSYRGKVFGGASGNRTPWYPEGGWIYSPVQSPMLLTLQHI